MRRITGALVTTMLVSCSGPMGPGPVSAPTEIKGDVVDRYDAQPYTYLRLKTETSGKLWVAVSTTRVDTSKPITIRNAVPLTDFDAGGGRHFKLVYMGTLAPGR